jgi:hypothetical protein
VALNGATPANASFGSLARLFNIRSRTPSPTEGALATCLDAVDGLRKAYDVFGAYESSADMTVGVEFLLGITDGIFRQLVHNEDVDLWSMINDPPTKIVDSRSMKKSIRKVRDAVASYCISSDLDSLKPVFRNLWEKSVVFSRFGRVVNSDANISTWRVYSDKALDSIENYRLGDLGRRTLSAFKLSILLKKVLEMMAPCSGHRASPVESFRGVDELLNAVEAFFRGPLFIPNEKCSELKSDLFDLSSALFEQVGGNVPDSVSLYRHANEWGEVHGMADTLYAVGNLVFWLNKLKADKKTEERIFSVESMRKTYRVHLGSLTPVEPRNVHAPFRLINFNYANSILNGLTTILDEMNRIVSSEVFVSREVYTKIYRDKLVLKRILDRLSTNGGIAVLSTN